MHLITHEYGMLSAKYGFGPSVDFGNFAAQTSVCTIILGSAIQNSEFDHLRNLLC